MNTFFVRMVMGVNMKRKDFYIGLNGLILVYLYILWVQSGYMINQLFDQFLSQYNLLVLWSIGNLIYWYRVKE